MEYKVDQDKCLRCGMCTGIASELFEFNDEGDIKVNNEIINEENKSEAEEAKNSCPVGAISSSEEEKK